MTRRHGAHVIAFCVLVLTPRESIAQGIIAKGGEWANGDVRLFAADTSQDGRNTTGLLALVQYRGFELGYQRFDFGPKQSFGARVPFGWIAPEAEPFSLSVYHYAGPLTDKETEGILTYQPIANLQVVGRGFDLPAGDGGLISALFRTDSDFNAENNVGAGAFVTSVLPRKVGGYAWAKIGALHDLYVGGGIYPNDYRYVVGMPELHGAAFWYFGLHPNTGRIMNQLLFSTDASYLSPVDLYATVVQIKPTDGFVTNGGVFKYQFPPISARGMGWTGGITHTKDLKLGDLLAEELDRYFGRIFVGGEYSGRLAAYGNGTVGVPVGGRLPDGDGFTRNFIRFVPTYDLQHRRGGLTSQVEIKM